MTACCVTHSYMMHAICSHANSHDARVNGDNQSHRDAHDQKRTKLTCVNTQQHVRQAHVHYGCTGGMQVALL